MNVLDWVLVAAFALTALWGFKTGLVSAALNAIAIYVALFLSGLFAGRILSLIWDGVESESLSTAIGYVIIFGASIIAGRIIANIIKKALKVTFMGWVDSLGGIVIGLVAGVLIAGGNTSHINPASRIRRLFGDHIPRPSSFTVLRRFSYECTASGSSGAAMRARL